MTRAGGAAALALVAVSCTVSRVDPKADITLSGTVQRQGGAPVPGAMLALTREGDAGDVFLTVASVGFACLDRKNPPATCDNARFATADTNGSFTYRVKGKETQSTFGYSAVLSLTTELPAREEEADGSNTTYRFHVQTEKLDLPIRLWEPKLAGRTGSFGARVSFPRLPSGLLPKQIDRGAIRYTIAFERGDNELVWRLDNARTVTTFDPRLLEDSTGTVRVIAGASDLDLSKGLGDEVALALRSGARAYESPIDPPLSRGKACGVMDERGKLYPISPCALTDGSFKAGFRPSVCAGETGCAEPRHDAAYVDLGRRMSANLIVVRGCQTGCRVDSSTDSRSWRLVGFAQDSENAAFPLTAPRLARYVRVTVSPVGALGEVSVWSGRPAVPDRSLLVSPQRFPNTPGSPSRAPVAAGPTKSRDFNFWALIAAMLLGGVGGAAAMLVIRRRSRRPV